MTDDTNGVPPPPEHPAKFVTMSDIERIIERLALPGNVVKNTESALTDVMPRLERLEDQVKTFATVWADSIDTRKFQLDRIEKDLSDFSDEIKTVKALVQEQIDLQTENDQRIKLMLRDVYGFGEGDETRVIGLIGRVQRNEAITNDLAAKIRFREGVVQLLTPLFKSTVFKAILAAVLGGGGIAAIIEVLKGIGG